MWEYNYDYLSHGLRGYKYIERKRGKNGKWQYIYPDSTEGKRIDAGRRVEEGINRPLTNPNRALLYGRTPGASVPKTKPSITRNGKASDNTAGVTSPKTGTNSKEAVKNLGTEIAGKLKDAYDKTLNNEEFKKYQAFKKYEKEHDEELFYDVLLKTMKAEEMIERGRQGEGKALLENAVQDIVKKYGVTAGKEVKDRAERRLYDMKNHPVTGVSLPDPTDYDALKKEVDDILKKQNKNGYSQNRR